MGQGKGDRLARKAKAPKNQPEMKKKKKNTKSAMKKRKQDEQDEAFLFDNNLEDGPKHQRDQLIRNVAAALDMFNQVPSGAFKSSSLGLIGYLFANGVTLSLSDTGAVSQDPHQISDSSEYL